MFLTQEQRQLRYTVRVYAYNCASEDPELTGSYFGITLGEIQDQGVVPDEDLDRILNCPYEDSILFTTRGSGYMIKVIPED